MKEIIEKLDRNARCYEGEARVMKPEGYRTLGPIEAGVIAQIMREAQAALIELTQERAA